MFLDSTGEGPNRTGPRGPGFATFGGPGIVPTGGLGAGLGSDAALLPDGVVKFVNKGSDLVLQVHYHPNGKERPTSRRSAFTSPRT